MNSWEHLVSGSNRTKIPTKFIKRGDYSPLPERKLTHQDYQELAIELAEEKPDSHLVIYGIEYWLVLFEITNPQLIERYRQMIISSVLGIEKEFRDARELTGKKTSGLEKLKNIRRTRPPGWPISSSESLFCAPHVLLYVPVLEVTSRWAPSSTKTQPGERVFLRRSPCR